MKLIDLICHLSDPYLRLDLFQPVREGEDEVECVWTGQACDLPHELSDRIIEAFGVTAEGLDIDLI